MSEIELKEELAKWLYPTDEERLERDVEVKSVNTNKSNHKNTLNNSDFVLTAWGQIKNITEGIKDKHYVYFGIKVLNEDRREDIIKFLHDFNIRYERELINKKGDNVSIRKPFLKQKLIEHLYN